MIEKPKFSVNYNISFGINVSQEEIDRIRKQLEEKKQEQFMIWDIALTTKSTDEEIAKFIGLMNQHSAEAVEMEMEEICTYY